MDFETFYSDIEKRATDMFNNYYSKWPGIQDKHFEIFVDRKAASFGGGSYVENEVLKIVIFSGTVKNYLSVINDILNLRSSLRINRVYHEDEKSKGWISAEGIIFKNGVPKIFDSKEINHHLTNLIMTFISRFIICHEFGHLFSGHYEQFKTINMHFIPMQMTGDEWIKLPDDKKLDIFTMEWDADSFAATDSMRELLFLWQYYDTQVQYRDFISREDLFFWWGFAISLIFHWVAELDCYMIYKKEILYKPKDRMLNTLNVALDCINGLYDKNIPASSLEEMRTNIARGAHNAEELYGKYSAKESIWLKKESDMSDSGLPIIEKHWQNLKEILKVYSFIDLEQ